MLLYGSALVGGWALQRGFDAAALDFDAERLHSSMQSRYGSAGVQRLNQWQVMLQAQKDRPLQQQLSAVNTFWNRAVLQSEDSMLWSQPDYWATPLEVLARGAGDCEDYVFAKYFTLRELGVAEDRLRMTYVRARIGGAGSSVTQAHMVLSYYATPDAVPLVLDNLVTGIRPASARPDLAPVFSFNMQGIFVGGATQASQPVDRVSRWREMLLRMNAEGLRD